MFGRRSAAIPLWADFCLLLNLLGVICKGVILRLLMA